MYFSVNENLLFSSSWASPMLYYFHIGNVSQIYATKKNGKVYEKKETKQKGGGREKVYKNR